MRALRITSSEPAAEEGVGERKPGKLLTGWRHEMKHQVAAGRQRICYGLLCDALYSLRAANNFATCL